MLLRARRQLVGLLLCSSMSVKAMRPRTAEAMYDYLRGRWQLTKAMDYTPGGGASGSFVGKATFEPLRCADGGVRLTYLEEGMATLGGSQSIAATKRLLWDLTTAPVKVHFDEALARDPESILASSRFFHAIDLADDPRVDPPPFVHLCDPDTYRGVFAFESDAAFAITWHVTGPKKDGTIIGKYTRTSDE